MTLWKGQNDADSKKSNGCQGRERDEKAEQRSFRAIKASCVILQQWIIYHYTFVQSHRMYTIKRERVM